MKIRFRVKKHSLKLISVFLAVFLWVYVLNSEKVQFEKTVQLEYVLPEDMFFAIRPVQEVIFMIEGPRAFVKNVVEREDRLIIDLNRANPRRQLNFAVDIIPTQLNLPFSMVVERVLPRKLQVSLEKKSSKAVPVRPKFSGELPEGFSFISAGIVPPEITVYGPSSVVGKLKEIQTHPIELEALVDHTEIPVEVNLSDERLKPAPASVLKFVYQLQAKANFFVKDVPIRFLTQNKKVSSPIKSAVLKLFVPEKIKNRSKISSSVQVWVDIPNGAKGKTKVPLKAIVPPGVHLVEISPKGIIVNVE